MTLVAFDFDGTLSDSEMTVLLGKQRDMVRTDEETQSVASRMDEITRRAMNDQIGYAESLRKRCSLLDGLPEGNAQAAFDSVELRPGAASAIERLRESGVYVAVLTGGFGRGVRSALETEGVTVDAIVANRLPVANGELTGEVAGPLIEGTKDDALEVLTAVVEESQETTVAVGDGANDLPMLETAGWAIGFDPKPSVEPACAVVVDSMGELEDVLATAGVFDGTYDPA